MCRCIGHTGKCDPFDQDVLRMSHQNRGISSKFLIKDNLSPADYLDVMDTIVSVEFLSGIYVIVTAKDEKSPLVLPFDRDPVLKYDGCIGRDIQRKLQVIGSFFQVQLSASNIGKVFQVRTENIIRACLLLAPGCVHVFFLLSIGFRGYSDHFAFCRRAVFDRDLYGRRVFSVFIFTGRIRISPAAEIIGIPWCKPAYRIALLSGGLDPEEFF